MKIAIMTMEAQDGRTKGTVGSSRIRGTWLLEKWPEAEAYRISKHYDAIIFQKVYFSRFMKVYSGIKILDICDPDWLEGRAVKESIELCDAVTCSSQALVDFVKSITEKPVFLVHDRMNLDYFKETKRHEGKARGVVWFGYSSNSVLIDMCLPTLKRLNLDLTVISELPYYPSSGIEGIDTTWIQAHVKNIKYDAESVNQEIVAGGDMVINPKRDDGKWHFKSDNKTITAWALGMPVALTAEDIERFIDPAERTKEAEIRLAEVRENWQTEKSVEEMKNIIQTIYDQKATEAAH